MNLRDAARLLDVSEETLRRWSRQGLLPGAGPEGLRLDREELVAWARERGLSIARAARDAGATPDDLLAAAVERGAVTAAVRPASAAEAIAVAIGALQDLSAERRAALLEEVLERERMAGTGLGRGVALPHPRRIPARTFDQPRVSVVFPDEPIDWAALDGEPVHTVLLLLSPTAPVHLEILARAAFAVRAPEFVPFLRQRPTQRELCERLRAMSKSA